MHYVCNNYGFKVDIFSLGCFLYTIMTLRKLPLEGTQLEFSADILAGRRPEFLQEVSLPQMLKCFLVIHLHLKDPSYPLPIFQCLQSCWEQKHTDRPSAKEIEETFQKSNCLKLKNFYETKYSIVTAAVVTSCVDNEIEEEKIWVSVQEDDSYKLVSYFFITDQDTSSHEQKKNPKFYEVVS